MCMKKILFLITTIGLFNSAQATAADLILGCINGNGYEIEISINQKDYNFLMYGSKLNKLFRKVDASFAYQLTALRASEEVLVTTTVGGTGLIKEDVYRCKIKN